MAQLVSDIQFTGSFGQFSAYRMKGSGKIILRKKGGASKEKIQKDPRFEKTRKMNAEFGGRSVASKCIMVSLFPLKALADYNLSGPLNSLTRPVQAMDTESVVGKRSIYFTRHPKLLEGFSLNKRNPFDSIIRNPIACTLDKKNLSASIEIPALIPGINFFVPPGRHHMYSIIIVLAVIPDVIFTENGYKPLSDKNSWYTISAWHPTAAGSKSMTLDVNLHGRRLESAVVPFSLMLCVGIRFGAMGMNEEVEQVKYAGAGKVVVVE
jgi:hypothetical protein